MCDKGPNFNVYKITSPKYEGIYFMTCYSFEFGKELNKFLKDHNLDLKDIDLEQVGSR